MRWPWQPKPGFVRINRKKLIELQHNALRALQLEAENAELERENQGIERETRALRFLAERAPGTAAETTAAKGVLNDLPIAADGTLHEAAFALLVDARVWELRDQQIAAVLDRKKG